MYRKLGGARDFGVLVGDLRARAVVLDDRERAIFFVLDFGPGALFGPNLRDFLNELGAGLAAEAGALSP